MERTKQLNEAKLALDEAWNSLGDENGSNINPTDAVSLLSQAKKVIDLEPPTTTSPELLYQAELLNKASNPNHPNRDVSAQHWFRLQGMRFRQSFMNSYFGLDTIHPAAELNRRSLAAKYASELEFSNLS